MVWDQKGAIGQSRGGKQTQRRVPVLRGTLDIGAQLRRRNDREERDLVERANRYFETSVLPGRRFESVTDFTVSSPGCCAKRFTRRRSSVRPRRSSMTEAHAGLPRCCPAISALRCPLAVDRCLRLLRSVNPRVIGRRVDVQVTLTDVVATAPASRWPATPAASPPHQTLTSSEHGRAPAPCARAHRH